MTDLPSQQLKLSTALRTHTCGELRMENIGQEVVLSGWVQKSRDLNHFCFIDLRDRYGTPKTLVFIKYIRHYSSRC